VAIAEAQGLMCAEEVVTERPLPGFDQAAIDGYAVRSVDVLGVGTGDEDDSDDAGSRSDGEVSLPVIGSIEAGARTPSRLQPAGGARTGLDRAHHREAHLTVGASPGLFGAVVLIIDTDAQHVHAADGVAVDGSLIEPRQRTLGDYFLCAHQALRLGDRDPDGSGSHRGGRYSSLLLLNRPHNTPF